ncbi:hypothetical protein TcasGA2_TC000488 [Tribolium castaneum]|uniref:Uncharacterized protein n=1 Tax=Tribolium castaneum TaxID=7070 RepID=D6WA08_TRICA|nr:hypothetical protein TcasGA2_TC000488 [Tribolium castaneum]
MHMNGIVNSIFTALSPVRRTSRQATLKIHYIVVLYGTTLTLIAPSCNNIVHGQPYRSETHGSARLLYICIICSVHRETVVLPNGRLPSFTAVGRNYVGVTRHEMALNGGFEAEPRADREDAGPPPTY